jgi:hypothetical protein
LLGLCIAARAMKIMDGLFAQLVLCDTLDTNNGKSVFVSLCMGDVGWSYIAYHCWSVSALLYVRLKNLGCPVRAVGVVRYVGQTILKICVGQILDAIHSIANGHIIPQCVRSGTFDRNLLISLAHLVHCGTFDRKILDALFAQLVLFDMLDRQS